MLNSVDFSGRPFHFIGIGGIGMSALAYILAKRKLPVSGSDISLSHITQRLQEQGAHIFWSQDAANLMHFRSTAERVTESSRSTNVVTLKSSESVRPIVPEAVLPQVVCSTAINPANSEYQAAIELGCPIFHRSDILAALIQEYESIAVAGTHGKTTTSSMIGYLLLKAGLDPTIVVGGEVNAWEGNARMGYGPYLVAEADESDGSLVKLSAAIGVVTNIELDHPDHYTTLDEVISTFKTFAQRCRILVGCIDCDTVRRDLQPQITYSLQDTQADYWVDRVVYRSEGTTAQVWERGTLLGQLVGSHLLRGVAGQIKDVRHTAVVEGYGAHLDMDALPAMMELPATGTKRPASVDGGQIGIEDALMLRGQRGIGDRTDQLFPCIAVQLTVGRIDLDDDAVLVADRQAVAHGLEDAPHMRIGIQLLDRLFLRGDRRSAFHAGHNAHEGEPEVTY